MLDIETLQKEAHRIRLAQGWWSEEATLDDWMADVHDSLSEARREYRAHGLEAWYTRYRGYWRESVPRGKARAGDRPEGFASRLADVVIRVAALTQEYGPRLSEDRITEILSQSFHPPQGIGAWVTQCHTAVTHAFDTSWGQDVYETEEYPENIIAWVARMSAHFNIDLDAAIAEKLAYYGTVLKQGIQEQRDQ